MRGAIDPPLPRPALRRAASFASSMRALLAGLAALLVMCAGHAADAWPDLQALPVNIYADPLLDAQGGGKFSLSGYTDAGMQPLGKGLQRISLTSPLLPHPMLGRTRFHLKVSQTQNSPNYVSLDVISTNKRCFVTSVDAVLTQGYTLGRIVNISPSLVVNSMTRMPRIGNTHSICTSNSGELTLIFMPPALDMLRLVVISHGLLGKRMAATSFAAEMPTDQ